MSEDTATNGAETLAEGGSNHGGDAAAAVGGSSHDIPGVEPSGLQIHPMDQFIPERLFGEGAIAWYTPTNVSLWMLLAVLAVALMMVVGTSGRAIIPRRAAMRCPSSPIS